MFSNCVVTICYFIDLFHIYLQTSNIIFSLFKGSLTILKRKRNTLFQNIKIQLIKSAHDIAKSGKINITQNICLVLSSNINLSLLKTMFVAYINFWWLIFFHIFPWIYGSRIFQQLFLAMIPIYLPDFSMVMLYKFSYLIQNSNLIMSLWPLLTVINIQIGTRGISWHTSNSTFLGISNELFSIVLICWMK